VSSLVDAQQGDPVELSLFRRTVQPLHVLCSLGSLFNFVYLDDFTLAGRAAVVAWDVYKVVMISGEVSSAFL